MSGPHHNISHFEPPTDYCPSGEQRSRGGTLAPCLANCQTCHPAQVNDMVSVKLGKLGLGQARLFPRLPQRLTTVHVRVVS